MFNTAGNTCPTKKDKLGVFARYKEESKPNQRKGNKTLYLLAVSHSVTPSSLFSLDYLYPLLDFSLPYEITLKSNNSVVATILKDGS